MPNPYAYASFHVDSAARVDQVINVEGARPEAEFQEPEGQYEAADPEQEQEADFTDSFSQQGKPRSIPTQCHYNKFKSYNYYYVYALSL